ncbi:hypothetical protein PULV_b0270 [Pseudoalteromonas ulvae UL12]|nr:hypothetical protein [Pseudoalteromonas ulvae UL12]
MAVMYFFFVFFHCRTSVVKTVTSVIALAMSFVTSAKPPH